MAKQSNGTGKKGHDESQASPLRRPAAGSPHPCPCLQESTKLLRVQYMLDKEDMENLDCRLHRS